MSRSNWIRAVLFLLLVAAIGISLLALPVKEYLAELLAWVSEIGPWGPIVLGAMYVPACLFFVPGWPLTMGAGFAFGLVRGVVAVSLGSVAGASAAFWAGRTLARGFVEKRVARNPRFQAIDQAVAKQGFKIVLLTRLSPAFPFNLLNYAFGLTKVSFRDYLLASWIGMLPGTIMYVYLGTALKSLADVFTGKLEGGLPQKLLILLGLVATVAVTVLITRLARSAFESTVKSRIPDQPVGHAADPEAA